jgi:hypothetical protein
MQENYLSLNPEFAASNQTFTDRQRILQQRLLEARGGPYAYGLGAVTGLAAGSYFWARA